VIGRSGHLKIGSSEPCKIYNRRTFIYREPLRFFLCVLCALCGKFGLIAFARIALEGKENVQGLSAEC
jgi:hypothetical protein